MKKYETGDIVKCVVTGIKEYGFFVVLEDNTSGLVHISEISDSFVRNILDFVRLDEVIYAKVLEYDSKDQNLKLSIKNIDYSPNRKKNHKIIETSSGFTNLKSSLEKWIEEKMTELH